MALTEAATARSRVRQLRLIVVLLVAVALLTLGLSICYEFTSPSLVHAGSMKLDSDLTISSLSEEAQQAGFVVGDRLHSISDQQISTLLDYRSTLRLKTPGTWTKVEVRRGEQFLPLSVIVKAKPLELRSIVLYLIAVAFVVLGTLVVFQRPQDRAARLFFLTALALGVYFALQQRDEIGFVYVQVFVLTLAPGLALHFCMTFPEERTLARPPWWVLLYVPGAILLVLTLMAFTESVAAGTGIWYASRFETLMNIDFAYLIAAGALGLVSMAYTYTTSPSARLRRQLQWIVWGLTCAIVAGIIDIVLTVTDAHTPLTSNLLLLGTICLPLGSALAILRYHLLDIDLVINRSLVYGLLTATLAAVYLSLISVLSSTLGIAAGSRNYTLVLFLSALLIGILVSPLRN
jgi:hypothetical protein